MNSPVSPSFYPLGDAAITVDFGNTIDESINRQVIGLFHYLQNNPPAGMKEAVPAYSSITIYYDVIIAARQDPRKTAYEWTRQQLENIITHYTVRDDGAERIMKIPVCYGNEFAPDLDAIAAAKKMTREEIVRRHISKQYRVYMLGFLPGFAYMGEVDESIAMPRLKQPRLKVSSGSVGIAGRQTGIYPLDSPGGWQIIGRTPLKLFNVNSGTTSYGDAIDNPLSLLQPGDKVNFYSITEDEFKNYQSRNS